MERLLGVLATSEGAQDERKTEGGRGGEGMKSTLALRNSETMSLLVGVVENVGVQTHVEHEESEEGGADDGGHVLAAEGAEGEGGGRRGGGDMGQGRGEGGRGAGRGGRNGDGLERGGKLRGRDREGGVAVIH